MGHRPQSEIPRYKISSPANNQVDMVMQTYVTSTHHVKRVICQKRNLTPRDDELRIASKLQVKYK